MKKNKKARFCRVAAARVNKIIAMLRLLGNCSFQGNYEYTDEQVEKIFRSLHLELNKIYNGFKCTLHGKGRFSLTNPASEYSSDGYEFPSVILPLPDGTKLRASAVDDENFPAINVWLQSDGENENQVCFVEYNPEHDSPFELCIGVYSSDSDECYFYKPFNTSKITEGREDDE